MRLFSQRHSNVEITWLVMFRSNKRMTSLWYLSSAVIMSVLINWAVLNFFCGGGGGGYHRQDWLCLAMLKKSLIQSFFIHTGSSVNLQKHPLIKYRKKFTSKT